MTPAETFAAYASLVAVGIVVGNFLAWLVIDAVNVLWTSRPRKAAR